MDASVRSIMTRDEVCDYMLQHELLPFGPVLDNLFEQACAHYEKEDSELFSMKRERVDFLLGRVDEFGTSSEIGNGRWDDEFCWVADAPFDAAHLRIDDGFVYLSSRWNVLTF